MVVFKLQTQNKQQAIYYYYPEQDYDDYGIIKVNLTLGDVQVQKCHNLDRKMLISVNELNDTTIYCYASHAINRIINDYNKQHKLPLRGKVMWY